MPSNSVLSQIEEIINRPRERNTSLALGWSNNLASRTFKDMFEFVNGQGRYVYNSQNRHGNNYQHYESPLFQLFKKIIYHFAGRNEDFQKFLNDWKEYVRDFSATHDGNPETADRMKWKIPQRGGQYDYQTQTHIPQIPVTDLGGITRLFFMSTKITMIPNTPSDQDPAAQTENHVYMSTETHALQKHLIRLNKNENVTIKIFKEKMGNGRIIYFNKASEHVVAALTMYSITSSWEHYSALLDNANTDQIDQVMGHLHSLLMSATPETWQAEIKHQPTWIKIKDLLNELEESLIKLSQSDDTVDGFAETWQLRLHKTEKEAAERLIEQEKSNADAAIQRFEQAQEKIREKQKFLRNILMNEADAEFLKKLFKMFKDIPGAIIHKDPSGSKLYCLYEAPFFPHKADHTMYRNQFKNIPENMRPSTRGSDLGSSRFAESLYSAIRTGNSSNQGYWHKHLVKGFKDDEYWPAFIRAFKRLMTEVFVSGETMLFMTICLVWNNENKTYVPSAVNPRGGGLPMPFQPYMSKRMWNPHMSSHNCWGPAASEMSVAMGKRDFETAFEYVRSASGTIVLSDGAGQNITNYLVGTGGNSDVTQTAENVKCYLRKGKEDKEALRDILADYVAIELHGVAPSVFLRPEEKPKEVRRTNLEDRKAWLESVKYTMPQGAGMEEIPNTNPTIYMIQGNQYVFLQSGDFLTPGRYAEYRDLFPDAPLAMGDEMDPNSPPGPVGAGVVGTPGVDAQFNATGAQGFAGNLAQMMGVVGSAGIDERAFWGPTGLNTQHVRMQFNPVTMRHDIFVNNQSIHVSEEDFIDLPALIIDMLHRQGVRYPRYTYRYCPQNRYYIRFENDGGNPMYIHIPNPPADFIGAVLEIPPQEFIFIPDVPAAPTPEQVAEIVRNAQAGMVEMSAAMHALGINPTGTLEDAARAAAEAGFVLEPTPINPEPTPETPVDALIDDPRYIQLHLNQADGDEANMFWEFPDEHVLDVPYLEFASRTINGPWLENVTPPPVDDPTVTVFYDTVEDTIVWRRNAIGTVVMTNVIDVIRRQRGGTQ